MNFTAKKENPEKKISVKISYLLRHNPEDLVMDKEGWINTADLLNKIGISKDDLDFIIENNDKKRFSYNIDGSKIRAVQGHSSKLGLKISFNEVKFPGIYYHGTCISRANSILKHGLRPGNRDHVHLSVDKQTATAVGRRHGDIVVIFEIDGNQMKKDGYKIYKAENGVILSKEIPPKYLKILK
jgi:putative RNA 2'-phosphotransferase